MNELNETVEVVGGFDKAVDTMKKLQRAYTTVRLDTELSSQSLDAIKTLRDMVEELVVAAYGPPPGPFKPGVVFDGGMKPGVVLAVPEKHEDVLATPATSRMTLTANEIADIIGASDLGERTERVIYERIYKAFKQATSDQGRAASPVPTYLVQAGKIPPGFILIDQPTLRAQMMAPAFDDRTRQILEIRIRELFKKPS